MIFIAKAGLVTVNLLNRCLRSVASVICLSMAPVGIVAADAAVPMDAESIYNQVCRICHATGLNGAPKYGNKILWSKVVQKGRETVYHNSINGLRAMPPRGGRATLTDAEVRSAVDLMVEGSGGWKD